MESESKLRQENASYKGFLRLPKKDKEKHVVVVVIVNIHNSLFDYNFYLRKSAGDLFLTDGGKKTDEEGNIIIREMRRK